MDKLTVSKCQSSDPQCSESATAPSAILHTAPQADPSAVRAPLAATPAGWFFAVTKRQRISEGRRLNEFSGATTEARELRMIVQADAELRYTPTLVVGSFRYTRQASHLGPTPDRTLPRTETNKLHHVAVKEDTCMKIHLPRPTSRTKTFESFVNFALNKYQSPL